MKERKVGSIEIENNERNIDALNIKIIYGNDVFKNQINARKTPIDDEIENLLRKYFIKTSKRNIHSMSVSIGGVEVFVYINSEHRLYEAKFVINDKRYKEDSMVDLKEAYKTMHNNCGIEVGDEVNIVRAAESKEMGWDEVWVSEKDRYVGRTGIIEKDDGKHGFMVRVDCDKLPLHYPFFVLEITKKTKKKKKKELQKQGGLNFQN